MSIISALHGGISTLLSNLFITLPLPTGDLSQQTIIVTGANTGLGLEACRHLIRVGVSTLILGVRNLQKGEEAKQQLLAGAAANKQNPPTIEVWHLDMDSYESVKAFAARAQKLERLDALLANAGMLTTEFSITEDNEKTLTTNVVSTFLLCLLLVPKLRSSAEKYNSLGRIVIPNSALHYMASLKELDVPTGKIFATLNDTKTADMGGRYALSKLLVIYGVREVAKRLNEGKQLVVLNTPNPSYCQSGLLDASGMGASFGARMADKYIARSTEMGSRALVNGLLASVESNGQYLTNCHVQAPSSQVVTGAKGTRIQGKFFDELAGKLQKISPGIMVGL